MNVLIIDDSRVMQLAVDKALRDAGHTSISAADGDEGWRLAIEQRPDVILLDIMLPGTPGTGILKRLKSDPAVSNIPVIVFTGLGGLNDSRLVKEGADACIQKTQIDLEKKSEDFVWLLEKTCKRKEKAAKSETSEAACAMKH